MWCLLVLDAADGFVVVAGGGFPENLDYRWLLDGDFVVASVVPFLDVDLTDGCALGPHAFDYALIFRGNTERRIVDVDLLVRRKGCPDSEAKFSQLSGI